MYPMAIISARRASLNATRRVTGGMVIVTITTAPTASTVLEFLNLYRNDIPNLESEAQNARFAQLEDDSLFTSPTLPFPQPASTTRQLQLLRRRRTC